MAIVAVRFPHGHEMAKALGHVMSALTEAKAERKSGFAIELVHDDGTVEKVHLGDHAGNEVKLNAGPVP